MSAEKLFVLEHLYEELRHYRAKEFQTFVFTFPIVAAALLPHFTGVKWLVPLVTIFGVVMINYLIRNHIRMSKLKVQIVTLQDDCGLTKHFGILDPEKWISKGKLSHLGTASYVIVLLLELGAVWSQSMR